MTWEQKRQMYLAEAHRKAQARLLAPAPRPKPVVEASLDGWSVVHDSARRLSWCVVGPSGRTVACRPARASAVAAMLRLARGAA